MSSLHHHLSPSPLAPGLALTLDPTAPHLSRRVITTAPFPLRSTLLTELPLLIWSCSVPEFASNLYNAFLTTPISSQALILDFFHPDISGETDYLSSAASALSLSPTHPTVTLLHLLLIIANFNAHSYTATTTVPHSGLFHASSKFEHSCHPNVHGSTTTSSMVYVTLSPLPAGTYVTSSYIGPSLHLPLRNRRSILEMTKYFHCECTRCVGFDHCRPLFCVSLKCNGVMLMCGRTEAWVCGECECVVDSGSDVIEEREVKESELIESLDEIVKSVDSAATFDDKLLVSLTSLRPLAAPILPPLHHFWCTFHAALSSLHAKAAATNATPQSARKRHTIQSATASFHAASWKNEINFNIANATTKLPSPYSTPNTKDGTLQLERIAERIKKTYGRFEPCVGSVGEAYEAGIKFHEVGETGLAKILIEPYVEFIEHTLMRERDVRMEEVWVIIGGRKMEEEEEKKGIERVGAAEVGMRERDKSENKNKIAKKRRR